jgi:hypothetical protein
LQKTFCVQEIEQINSIQAKEESKRTKSVVFAGSEDLLAATDSQESEK